MRKTETIFLGDKVKTKKTFRPLLPNDDRFDPKGQEYEGIVVGKRGSYLMVDFHEKLPFTHYLDNMLQEATGCAVEYKHLIVTETYTSDDKKQQEFVGLMKEMKFGEMSRLPRQIREKEDRIRSISSSVKNLLRDIGNYERDIEKENFSLKDLKSKKASTTVDTDLLEKQYKNMMKNPKIDSVQIVENGADVNVLVTTKDLTYRNPRTAIKDYNLGAYKILIPTDETLEIKAVNFKKHLQKFQYSHPCIQSGSVCFGTAMIAEMKKLRSIGNIVNIAHMIINFLEEPNYGHPHIGDVEFSCAQKVTMKPKNELDWFSPDYWRNNETWDGTKYTSELNKARDVFNKLNEDAGIDTSVCPECGGEEWSDDSCVNCGYDL